MKVSCYGATDRGQVREHNEDAMSVDENRRVYCVADGLGGLPEGALASRIATEELANWLGEHPHDKPLQLGPLFQHINKRVIEQGREISEDVGIGTTLTLCEIREWRARIGHIGDTVLFKLRGETFRQLTTDHTMEQEIKDRLRPGEEAYIPEYFAHTLTRCIGQDMGGSPDIFEEAISPGDRLLLASDGITKVFEDPEIRRQLMEAETAEKLVSFFIEEGNNRGGPDNLTAVALFIEGA
jgi:protein phosphatase